MENNKRPRGGNFSPEEKALVVRIVKSYANIIENKKTDGMSVKQKEAAWEKITCFFNSQSSVLKRNTKQIKTFYDNYKRRCKQLRNQEKAERQKGNGPLPKGMIDDTASELLSMIPDQTENPIDFNTIYNMEQNSEEAKETSDVKCDEIFVPFAQEPARLSPSPTMPIKIEKDDTAEPSTTEENIVPIDPQSPQSEEAPSLCEPSPCCDAPPSEKSRIRWSARRSRISPPPKSESTVACEQLIKLSHKRRELCEQETSNLQERHTAEMELIRLKTETELMKQELIRQMLKNVDSV